jgi:hypothetical protein
VVNVFRSRRCIHISIAAALFALNIWICWPLLFIKYLPYFVSIEPVFFALAQAIRHWSDLGWWRQWYCDGSTSRFSQRPDDFVFVMEMAIVMALADVVVPLVTDGAPAGSRWSSV